MDICASVKCSDKVIRVKLFDLVKYEFFRNQYDILNSQITHESKTLTNYNGVCQNVDIYVIPELTLSCRSDILVDLISNSTFVIKPGVYSENLLELMMYNRMYEFNHAFAMCSAWGSPAAYLSLLSYVKEKLPQFNVFVFLESFVMRNTLLEHVLVNCKSFFNANPISYAILLDTLECINDVIVQTYKGEHDASILIKLVQFIAWCCEIELVEKVREKFTIDKIGLLMGAFVQCHHMCYFDFFDRNYYNRELDKIFNELRQLEKYGIIFSMPIDAYKFYNKKE